MTDVRRAIIVTMNRDLFLLLVIFSEAIIIRAVIHRFRMIRVNDMLSIKNILEV